MLYLIRAINILEGKMPRKEGREEPQKKIIEVRIIGYRNYQEEVTIAGTKKIGWIENVSP